MAKRQSRTRRNPRSYPLRDRGTEKPTLVVVGERGQLVHIYDPEEEEILCGSGKNAGRYPEGANREAVLRKRQSQARVFYPASRATGVTCYRCAKLADINSRAGREPWDRG